MNVSICLATSLTCSLPLRMNIMAKSGIIVIRMVRNPLQELQFPAVRQLVSYANIRTSMKANPKKTIVGVFQSVLLSTSKNSAA